MAVGFINVSQPLEPGASVNVEFRFGVQRGGIFREKVPDFGLAKLSSFFVNIEALP
jgi:hypothetical protein